jgi:hypothetical protein
MKKVTNILKIFFSLLSLSLIVFLAFFMITRF